MRSCLPESQTALRTFSILTNLLLGVKDGGASVRKWTRKGGHGRYL